MASKSRKFWGNLAAFGLPILGGAVAGPVGAAAGGAIGGSLQGKGAVKGAISGGLGSFGAAKALNVPAGGIIGGGGAGGGGGFLSGIGSALSKFFSGGDALAAPATGSGTGIAGGITKAASSVLPYATPPIVNPLALQQANSLDSGGNPGGGGGSLLNKFGGLLSKNKLATAGIGSILAGFGLGRSPEVPELPPSVEEYRNQVKSGGSPLGQLGDQRLSELLNQSFEGVSADEEAAITRNLEEERNREVDQVRDLYRNLRPGTDPSSDSAFNRDLAEVNKRYDQLRNDTLINNRRNVRNNFNNQRLQQVLASSNLDASQLQQLQQIAQYDIDRIALEFGIRREDAQQLKNFLLQEGQFLLNSGLAPQQSFLDQLFT